MSSDVIVGLQKESRSLTFGFLVSVLTLVVSFGSWPSFLTLLIIGSFYLLIPGSFVAHFAGLAGHLRRALSPVLGVTLLFAQGTLSLWAGFWAPRPMLTLTSGFFALGCVFSLTGRLRSLGWHRWLDSFKVDLKSLFAVTRLKPSKIWIALALVNLLVLALWLFSLPSIADAPAKAGGLLLSAKPLFALSLLTTTLVFAWAIRKRVYGWAVVSIALSVAILRLTAPLTQDAAIYPWTYKHVGVVEAILHYRTLLPDVDIYHQWPSFFAGFAFLTEITGITSLQFAAWITAGIHVLLSLSVYALAKNLSLTTPSALVATFLVSILSWVGQDYFAPQSIAFVFALAILILLTTKPLKPTLSWLAIIIFAILVPTHQLTPFWVLGVAVLLAVATVIPLWPVFSMAGIAIGFVISRWEIIDSYGIFSGFDIVSNATTNSVASSSAEENLAQLFFQGTALALWGLAFVVLIYRLFKNRKGLYTTGVIAFSPFLLLAAQNYGGEAILRVFLFSTAGCAIVIAPAITGYLQAGRRFYDWRFISANLLLVAYLFLGSMSYFVNWFHNLISVEQLEVNDALLDDLPGSAFISPLVSKWPIRSSWGYAFRYQDTWNFDHAFVADVFDADESFEVIASNLEKALGEEKPQPTFLLYDDSMERYAHAKGLIREEGDLRALLDFLITRTGWELVYDQDGILVVRYVPSGLQADVIESWELTR